MPISDVRLGAALVGLGALPFAAAALVDEADSAGDRLWCPFREVTGLPCPFCGATRAFALAAHGDLEFVEFNAVWVVVALAALVTGAAVLAARVLGRRGPPIRTAVRDARAGLLVAAVVLAAWAWAFAQRGAITA